MNTPQIDDSDIKAAMNSLNSLHLSDEERHVNDRNAIEAAAREMLGHKLRAKAFFKRCTYEQIQWFKESLNEVLELKEEEELERLAQEEKKQEALNKVRELLKESGFDESILLEMNELKTSSAPQGQQAIRIDRGKATIKTKKKAPSGKTKMVRMRCEIFGKTHVWNGQNRVPNAFRIFVAMGNRFADTVLPEGEWYETSETRAKFIASKYPKAKALLKKYLELGYPEFANSNKFDKRLLSM